jgi:hypothetical protein
MPIHFEDNERWCSDSTDMRSKIMMLTRFSVGSLVSFVCLFAASTAGAQVTHFMGNAAEKTDEFEVNGPWLLDWSARSPSKLPCNYEIWAEDGFEGLPCNLELRLLDASTGNYLGTIAQLEGEGSGFKLFEKPGRYRVDVTSQHVVWELLIEEVDEARAAELKSLTDNGPSLSDRARAATRQVAADAFGSWRPVDDETLLLIAEDETSGYRVTFSPACPGLSKTTALSFVTALDAGVELYDSILMDDGTRCYFNRVVPTIVE